MAEPEELEPDDAPPRVARRADARADDEDGDDDRDYEERHRRRNDRYVKYDEDGTELTSSDTTWAVLSHVGVFVIGIIAPILLLVIFGEKSKFVAKHARESLNYQLTVILAAVLLYAVAAGVGFGVYGLTDKPEAGIITGYLLAFIPAMGMGIANIVFLILATIKAAKGEHYRYPVCIRFFGTPASE